MKDQHPNLQIRIYGIDGSTQTFTQNDPELVNRTLRELNPTLLFTEDKIKIAGEDSETAFLPPLLARIDLVTDRLSVWDFPFVLGAPVELTEAEFMDCVRNLQRWESPGWRGDIPMFLDVAMAGGQHSFLWLEVIGGLPTARLGRIYSVLKKRRLIFGLRAGGIGILNLANLVRFSVHPESPEVATIAGSAHHGIDQQRPSLMENQSQRRSANGKPRPTISSRNINVAIELHEAK